MQNPIACAIGGTLSRHIDKFGDTPHWITDNGFSSR